MEEKELLLAYLSKTLNMDNSGVASLIYNEDGQALKPDALNTLVSKQAEIIAKNRGKFDEGHKAGMKKKAEELESMLREKFDLSTDVTGVDALVEEALAKVSASQGGSKQVTDDDIKKSKIYVDLQTEVAKLKKEADKRVEEARNEVETKYKKAGIRQSVQQSALSKLSKMNPILSKDESKARNQQKLLLNELNDYDFELHGEGDSARYIPLTKDGKVLEDNLGHPISFDDLVSNIASKYYDFQESDSRSSGGDPTKKGASGSGGGAGTVAGITLRKPTSQQDWFKQHEEIESNTQLKSDEKLKLQSELLQMWKNPTEVK